jgi:predicted nucleotidyltransferase
MLFKSLVGSHNYNLNTETSDKDWKAFVYPTFEDLYKGKMFSEATITDTEDVDIHDIRKLPELFWKANINFVEILHSNEIKYFSTPRELLEIFNLKDEISKMNLPYLFNACVGMHLEKMKRLDKASDGTQHLLDAYNYNTKEALHAYRVLDFLERFADNGFSSFRIAMTYEERRNYMLTIKDGKYSREEFIDFAGEKLQFVLIHYKEKYMAQKPNEELKLHLEDLVMNLVKKEIINQK